MRNSWLVFMVWLVLRGAAVMVIPFSIFWALATISPAWMVPYTPATAVAFWVLYVAVRIGVQTIRYSEWNFSVFS